MKTEDTKLPTPKHDPESAESAPLQVLVIWFAIHAFYTLPSPSKQPVNKTSAVLRTLTCRSDKEMPLR